MLKKLISIVWKLVITIGLLFLIIDTLMPPTFIYKATSKYDRVCTDIRVFHSIFELFKEENSIYPDKEDGFRALLENSFSHKYPNYRQMIKKIPIDPWGNPYIYLYINAEEFEIWSYGSDGKVGGGEDVKDFNYSKCVK